ncbi:MAG: hypothetical protein E7197_04605 [Anaerovibrio sp.]|nr:hypothetical protein [Anaerovibrio sp.]
MKLYYDAAYGLLFICAGLGIGYFDAYLERAIRHYITYYNKHRIKSKLGWLSPVDYRLHHAAA